jgi:outer membrane protein OmpA-like peptidoglycan-associated protein
MNRLYFAYAPFVILISVLSSSCAFNTKKDSKIEVTAPNTTGKENTPSPTIPGTFHSSTSSIEAKLAAAQEGSSDVAEIQFEKGSSELSPANQKRIEEAITSAQAKAKVPHASVVSWSDSEMPKKEDQDLSQDQVKLAQTRGTVVQHFLESQHKGIKWLKDRALSENSLNQIMCALNKHSDLPRAVIRKQAIQLLS